ncbi:MAG: DUF2497 domain-containing protein [Pseudomonadota bacterium]
MSEADNSQQEPTMEEILASIRRIISEDGDEAEDGGEAEAPAEDAIDAEALVADEPAPEIEEPVEVDEPPAPQAIEDTAPDIDFEEAPAEDDVVVLDNPIEPPELEPEPLAEDDLMFAEDEPEPFQEPLVASADIDATLIGEQAAVAASAAFSRLASHMAISPGTSNTIEDVVREMLRPLLKQWLDDNLPPIVERMVEDEIHRVARLAPRRFDIR